MKVEYDPIRKVYTVTVYHENGRSEIRCAADRTSLTEMVLTGIENRFNYVNGI
jgi:hypothetical protein